MEYRFLGKTGVRISQLALGTMSFGGDADDATSAALFARAREAGINFFDCADVYAKGRSEEILGKLISDCRDELVISTKAYFPTGTDPNARGSSRFHLVRAVEASLKRLATDRIDLFFLHRFDEMTAVDETLSALETLIQQGKILYPAVSNFSAWQTAKTLAVAELRGLSPIVASQPMYNLLKRQAEVEILPHAVSEGLAVVTYSPLAGGLLSGKYGVGRAPASGRVVENVMYKTRYGAASYFEIAESFTALAHDLGYHPATLAIAWVAAQAGVTAPLIGARSLEQLEPCLAAANLSLSAEVLARISALSPEPPPATDRNEEKSAHNYGSR